MSARFVINQVRFIGSLRRFRPYYCEFCQTRMHKLVICITASLLGWAIAANGQSAKEIMYVGTYSVRGSEGVYVFEFDRKAGTMQPIQSVSNAKSPSFLALHPSGKYLYSVNEGADKLGGVSAYAVDKATGKLTFLNGQSC